MSCTICGKSKKRFPWDGFVQWTQDLVCVVCQTWAARALCAHVGIDR
jgi:hypothetical protein